MLLMNGFIESSISGFLSAADLFYRLGASVRLLC
jgi:hypothetical protein